MSSKIADIGNKPIFVIIGLIASIIGIVVFIFGKQSIREFGAETSPVPPNPIVVTVVVEPGSFPTSAPQVVVITATADQIFMTALLQSAQPSPGQPVHSSPDLEAQVDPDNPEGFLRWYFHEVWATRDYEDLWGYLSVDFRQRLNQDFSMYESNWNAIGSIQEPIDITYEGKDGISLKYRVQYTTVSRKSGFTDRRRDLYWLYFNAIKGHWEFK